MSFDLGPRFQISAATTAPGRGAVAASRVGSPAFAIEARRSGTCRLAERPRLIIEGASRGRMSEGCESDSVEGDALVDFRFKKLEGNWAKFAFTWGRGG
jgi:hypothetical protein